METKTVQQSAKFESKTSSRSVNTTIQNGFHGEIDSLESMLKDMRENHNKIIQDHFEGDKDRMLTHMSNMMDTHLSDTTLVSLPNHPPIDNETSGLKEYQDHYQVEVDTSGYTPDEITVKTVNNMVAIEGKHQEKVEGKSQTSKHFSRKFSLPPNVDPETVTPSLTKDGLLTITAYKEQKMLEVGSGDLSTERTVVIQRRRSRTPQPPHTSKVQITNDDDPVRELIHKMNERQQSILQQHYRGDSEEMVRHCQQLVEHQMGNDPFARLFHRSLSNTATQQEVSNTSNEMTIRLDVRQYLEKEISVKTVERYLMVEAEDEDKEGTTMKHVIKRYKLPNDVSTTDITSELDDEGILVIHVPRPQPFQDTGTVVPLVSEEEAKEKAQKRYRTEIQVNV